MTDDTVNARLSWCPGNAKKYWAEAPEGRYVVVLYGDYWNVDHRCGVRGFKRRQLGTAATAKEAMAIAQADYETEPQESAS